MEKDQSPHSTSLLEQNKDTNLLALSPYLGSLNLLPEAINDHVDQLLKKGNELSEGIISRIIDLSIPMPEIEFLFEREGTGCFPIGDIVVIKGKQKAGKSTLLACLITALLKGDYMGFKAKKFECSVIYVDTEQNPANTRGLAKKIHSLCGYTTTQNNPKILVINLRSDDPVERIKYILEAVEKFKPQMLFIDGIKDLITNGDINDPKTSGEVVQKMMTISKENHLAIVTVLHENKNDSNLRGHLGSEIVNKCSECWQVKKSGQIFEVEQTDSRNKPVEGFSFTLDNMGLPIPLAYTPKMSMQERTESKSKDTFRQCLPPMKNLSYTDLSNLYCQYYKCGVSTARSHISKGIKQGILLQQTDGNYKFNYNSS